MISNRQSHLSFVYFGTHQDAKTGIALKQQQQQQQQQLYLEQRYLG